ncbi:RDD family protein [Bacteroidales bacterium OttesenSCG-928-A17]|nr:RDD family protein [Bacteroidales bacterium OttesenSCG-928-A17]
MESINIVTGQFVTIRYEPASVIRRGFALFLDGLIIAIYSFFLGYLFDYFDFFFRSALFGIDNLLIFLLFVPVIFYPLLFEFLTGGQTPGKMILRIRVVNVDGSSPGFLAYFLRWLLLFIDLFPSGLGIGMLFITLSPHHQRLGDMAAGTIVVRSAKPIELDIERDFMEYSPDYRPVFPQVELLSDGQIRFISKILFEIRDARSTVSSTASLAAKVKETIKVETELDDALFLETVVRDYNFYAMALSN